MYRTNNYKLVKKQRAIITRIEEIKKVSKFAEDRKVALLQISIRNACISISNLDTKREIKSYTSIIALKLSQTFEDP